MWYRFRGTTKQRVMRDYTGVLGKEEGGGLGVVIHWGVRLNKPARWRLIPRTKNGGLAEWRAASVQDLTGDWCFDSLFDIL